MTDWEPATEVEAAMRDALRAGDQELYFRILARSELLLPVSADALAGRVPMGWGTWTTGGRTHVLAFTSSEALQVCLADNAGSARGIAYHELAGGWPNLEWWLAVNPGLPIEGYLPAWFVSQLARGDVRLPGRTMGARARLERAESGSRARATAVVPGQIVQPAGPGGRPATLGRLARMGEAQARSEARRRETPAKAEPRVVLEPGPEDILDRGASFTGRPIPPVVPGPGEAEPVATQPGRASGGPASASDRTGETWVRAEGIDPDRLPARTEQSRRQEMARRAEQARREEVARHEEVARRDEEARREHPRRQEVAAREDALLEQARLDAARREAEGREAARLEAARVAEQARRADEELRAQEAVRAEEALRAEEARLVEQARQAREARLEQARLEQERRAEEARREDEFRQEVSRRQDETRRLAVLAGAPARPPAAAEQPTSAPRPVPADDVKPAQVDAPFDLATVPDFTPANSVEESLLNAAGDGSTDNFLSTLLLARVLLPVGDGSAPGARPGGEGFVWRTETIDDEPYLVAFTSPERLAEHLGAETQTVSVKFVSLISRWPDEGWSFAVNPGTPVGAKLPGAQIVALANWAAEVGLGADDTEEPAAAAQQEGGRPQPARVAPDKPRPTMMQKTIAPSQVDYYLDRGYDRVSGFVHRLEEVAHLDRPAKLYIALGLDYAGSPFKPDAEEVFVVRWPAYRPSLYRIPYGGQTESAMRAMEGWVIERPPFRGNGFAPSDTTDVIAEFKVDSARLPHGAELWRIDAEGSETKVAVLDADAPGWQKTGEGER
ncbi:MAG TPA: SseB family protein [Asanoa sp.]